MENKQNVKNESGVENSKYDEFKINHSDDAFENCFHFHKS